MTVEVSGRFQSDKSWNGFTTEQTRVLVEVSHPGKGAIGRLGVNFLLLFVKENFGIAEAGSFLLKKCFENRMGGTSATRRRKMIRLLGVSRGGLL